MNATDALRLADPAYALPADEMDERLLLEILQAPMEGTPAVPPTRPRPAKRRVLASAITLVIVAAASFGVVHWAGDRQSRPVAAPGPSASLPFAADIPWGSAVLEADGMTLHLLANWDAIAERFCTTTPTEQVVVRERAQQVVITVRGFARPGPPNTRCAFDKEPSTEPQTVHLSAPLGSRTVIDGSDAGVRIVLPEMTVPTVQDVPRGFVAAGLVWADGRSPLDRTGATRRWTRGSGEQRTVLLLQVILPAPLPTSGQRFDGDPVIGDAVGEGQVRGRSATRYRLVGDGRTETTVRWESSRGERFSLSESAPTSRAIDPAQLESIAQSVG